MHSPNFNTIWGSTSPAGATAMNLGPAWCRGTAAGGVPLPHYNNRVVFPLGQWVDRKHMPFRPRILGAQADLALAKKWLGSCKSGGATRCCPTTSTTPGLRLIDCNSLKVVSAPAGGEYAALNYVWGASHRPKHAGRSKYEYAPQPGIPPTWSWMAWRRKQLTWLVFKSKQLSNFSVLSWMWVETSAELALDVSNTLASPNSDDGMQNISTARVIYLKGRLIQWPKLENID